MAFDEGKRSGLLGGVGSAHTWGEEGSTMMKEQWIITIQREGVGETTLRQNVENTCTTKSKSPQAREWQSSRGGGSGGLPGCRGEYWDKSRRNSANNLYCWHHLYPNTVPIHSKVTETWQWLTDATASQWRFLHFVGWVVEVGLNHLVMYQHSCCWFASSQIEIIQQPLLQHSPTAHLMVVPNCWVNLEVWCRPKQHFCLEQVSLLALCSKQRAEFITEFILMKLHICLSREVSLKAESAVFWFATSIFSPHQLCS